MSWVECDLLNLGEVVLGVLVQGELSDLAERELVLRPDVCQVKDVDTLVLPNLLSLLSRHGLDLDVPAWEVTLLNGLIQVLGGEVWSVAERILLCDEVGALLRLEVQLHVNPVTVLVNELVGVANVAVHLAVALGNTTVSEQNHELMHTLGVLRCVVPEGSRIVRVCKMGSWVTLLGMDEHGELRWVSQEEDGCVVGDNIPIALLGPELDRETTRVSGTVVRTRLATNCGESD
jgi:hypothetical protein